ncbi:MAG: radical SAM protein [Candidatus Falkowbacteria bacterium]
MINAVLLVRPSAEGKKEFPFGLLYVGTALKQKGYKVKIIDLHDNPLLEDKIIDILLNSSNTMLGISALSLQYHWVKNLTLKIKKILPHTPIVIGGHIAVMHEMILNKTGVDYVCLGEGENALPELIEKINKNESVDDVLGIAYKKGDAIYKTGFRPLVKDFITPDYDLINVSRYLIHPGKDFFFSRSKEYADQAQDNDKLAAVMFSRGCVGGCTFCYRHLPGFRQASVDWSWNHLMLLHNKYGVKYFRIDDELFTNDPVWFADFYKKAVNSKIDILFRISGLRVDSVNDELLLKLKKMGCIAINYGIESGSQKILDNMNKRTTVAQNHLAIKKTIGHGMKVMAYVMLGYEGETKKTLRETLDLLLGTDIKPEEISVFYTVPLPGSKLYQDCLKKGLIKDQEAFVEGLHDKIADQHNRYLIQLGEVSSKELFGFEKKFFFLLNLKNIIPADSLAFKIIYKIVFLIPYKSRVNGIFVLGQKILRKVYKYFYNNDKR